MGLSGRGLATEPDSSSDKDKTPVRDYSHRITMHSTPFDDVTPAERKADLDLPDDYQDHSPSVYEGNFYQSISPGLSTLPPQQPPSRPQKMKKKKDTNWLKISTDQEEKNTDESFSPSGWGWLADGAMNMQQIDQERMDGRNDDIDNAETEKDDKFSLTSFSPESETDDEEAFSDNSSRWKSRDPFERDIWKDTSKQDNQADYLSWDTYQDLDEESGNWHTQDKNTGSRKDARRYRNPKTDHGYEEKQETPREDEELYGGKAMWRRNKKDFSSTRNLADHSLNEQQDRNSFSSSQMKMPSFSVNQTVDYSSYNGQQSSDYSSYKPLNQRSTYSQPSSFTKNSQAYSDRSTFKPVGDFVTHRPPSFGHSSQRSFTGDGSLRPYQPASPARPSDSFSSSSFQNEQISSGYQPLPSQQFIPSRFQ